MINQAMNVDPRAIVCEEFGHHFWQKTFSAESIVMPGPFYVLLIPHLIAFLPSDINGPRGT